MNVTSGLVRFAVALAILISVSIPVRAATVHYSFGVEATDFSPTGAPVDPVHGLFQLSFDPTQNYSNSTSGITGTGDIELGSSLAFSYDAASQDMSIGGIAGFFGVFSVGLGTDDFLLIISSFISNPIPSLFAYSQVGSESLFLATSLELEVTPVPIPLPILLFASALGLLGLFARRGKRQAEAVA